MSATVFQLRPYVFVALTGVTLLLHYMASCLIVVRTSNLRQYTRAVTQEPGQWSQHGEEKQYRTKCQSSVNTQQKVLTSTL
jgi:hypothetical protein